MNNRGRKRVTVKPKHPNPLFEQWLTEWRDKAIENDSKMQYCFSQALTTLRKYPLPLESGKDCKILKGFGEKLCKMLDDKLKQYRNEGGNLHLNTDDQGSTSSARSSQPVELKRANKCLREYIPQHGSGAYAILITLYEKGLDPEFPGNLTKKELTHHAQHLCNISFTKPGPDSWYTGWSSMKTLLEKNLVHKHGTPPRFNLTDEGTTLAKKLYIQQKIEEFQKEQENETLIPAKISGNCVSDVSPSFSGNYESVGSDVPVPKKNVPPVRKKDEPPIWRTTSSTSTSSAVTTHETVINDPPKRKKNDAPIWRTSSSTSTSSTVTTYETVIFEPNSFEIILLVDTQEMNGSKTDFEQDPIIRELKKLNVRHEIRNLKIGDYTWICRDNSNNELILPYIIERKRMDDLGNSIKDDRFHEQKFRLKQSGIQNLIYLIENHGKNEHVGLPITTLHQAAINTLVHDGFTVKFTDNGKASCGYLACLTKFLENLFKNKTLVSSAKEDLQPSTLDDDLIQLMHFQEFNKSSSKSKHFKVKEMFVRQLLQVKGMSVDKALAIVEKYPTPSLLKLHYNDKGSAEGEKLLSSIQYGPLKKNVGPVLSRIIYQLFCKNSY